MIMISTITRILATYMLASYVLDFQVLFLESSYIVLTRKMCSSVIL